MKWLDRTLIASPIYYGLCLSEKDFHKELKRLNVPKDTWPSFLKTPQADAAAHFFENAEKESVIVCIGSRKKVTPIQIYAILTHEAVHIWQRIKEYIGEDYPSKEFEAYAIQGIAQNLMFAYRDMKAIKK